MSELHPSQLHQYMQLYSRAKWASWGCLTTSILLLSLSFSLRKESKQYKPWLFGGSVAVLFVGKSQRRTVTQLQIALGDFEEISRFNFQSWVKLRTQSTAQLAVTIPAAAANWQPDNLITDPVEYVNRVQKHVALVGGTGDGKSTQAQYFSTRIGGKVIVYDVDSGLGDWAWVEPESLIGDGGLPSVDEAMGEALLHLEKMRVYRKEVSKDIPREFARFYIAEEFPVLADCDNAPQWIKQHAKVGRKRKQFIMVLAQNDTAANFALEGDADILDTCFVRIRLGKKAQDYARTALKNPQIEQWLKAGGKKRFMIDDRPCELDLSSWSVGEYASSNSPAGQLTAPERTESPALPTFDDPKLQKIIDVWNIRQDWVSARDCQRSGSLFVGMHPDDIRYLFVTLETQGHGETAGNEGKIKWRLRTSDVDSD